MIGSFVNSCLISCLVFSLTSPLKAQRFSSNSGEIKFTSRADLELIKATSNKVQGILDVSNRQFAFLVSIPTFEGFNSSLQRKHFNDNYLESERFPAARFAGKIIEEIDFSTPGTYEVRAKGELDIHGQKQVRIIKGKIIVSATNIQIQAVFTVPLTDHNITIPKIVNQKIATEILVEFICVLSPQL